MGIDLSDLKVTRSAVTDAIATITLDRPERLNAWTGRMHTEYRSLLSRAGVDASVRVIVVTGAGRGFCAGADTRALEGHVTRGGYDAGVDEDLARPGWGVHLSSTPTLPITLASPNRSSPRSTAPRPESGSFWPATAISVLLPKEPS